MAQHPLKLHDGKIYKTVDIGAFTIDRVLRSIVAKPMIGWSGGQIPMELWRQILGFFQMAYDDYKSEAIVRLFYNENLKQWKALAFEQWGFGLAVEDDITTELSLELRKMMPVGYEMAGTIHSHCAASAWQSSVDKKDEDKKIGVHITVGKLDQDVLDLDIRATFKNAEGETTWLDWFEHPIWLQELIPGMWELSLRHYLANMETLPFPEEWLKAYHHETRKSPIISLVDDGDDWISKGSNDSIVPLLSRTAAEEEKQQFSKERAHIMANIVTALEVYGITLKEIFSAYRQGNQSHLM